MDLQASLKQIEASRDEPLVELEKIFGYASLDKWLQLDFGDLLCNCLSEITEGGPDYPKKRSYLTNYLVILNAIIPPIPNFMEIELEDDAKYSKNCPNHCNELTLVDELVSKIVKPLFTLFHQTFFHKSLLSKVFLKAIYHTTETTIKDNEDVFSEKLFEFMNYYLEPCCHSESHTIVALVIILTEKMSDDWFQEVLGPKIFLKLRFLVLRNGETVCPHVNYLRKLYNGLDFEKRLESRVPTWISLMTRNTCLKKRALRQF